MGGGVGSAGGCEMQGLKKVKQPYSGCSPIQSALLCPAQLKSPSFKEGNKLKQKQADPDYRCKGPVPYSSLTIEARAPSAFPLRACILTLKIETILGKLFAKKKREVKRHHHPQRRIIPSLFRSLPKQSLLQLLDIHSQISFCLTASRVKKGKNRPPFRQEPSAQTQ